MYVYRLRSLWLPLRAIVPVYFISPQIIAFSLNIQPLVPLLRTHLPTHVFLTVVPTTVIAKATIGFDEYLYPIAR